MLTVPAQTTLGPKHPCSRESVAKYTSVNKTEGARVRQVSCLKFGPIIMNGTMQTFAISHVWQSEDMKHGIFPKISPLALSVPHHGSTTSATPVKSYGNREFYAKKIGTSPEHQRLLVTRSEAQGHMRWILIGVFTY